jgi:hypothetical protein
MIFVLLGHLRTLPSPAPVSVLFCSAPHFAGFGLSPVRACPAPLRPDHQILRVPFCVFASLREPSYASRPTPMTAPLPCLRPRPDAPSLSLTIKFFEFPFAALRLCVNPLHASNHFGKNCHRRYSGHQEEHSDDHHQHFSARRDEGLCRISDGPGGLCLGQIVSAYIDTLCPEKASQARTRSQDPGRPATCGGRDNPRGMAIN